MDLIMPGMDGYRACKILRFDPAARNIPIIFFMAKDAYMATPMGINMIDQLVWVPCHF
ncbi:MAG: CheY-like chemotaxis protein [Candidatus Omnitrophota bacterium]|jgi:CheY-like chemotaxis protein